MESCSRRFSSSSGTTVTMYESVSTTLARIPPLYHSPKWHVPQQEILGAIRQCRRYFRMYIIVADFEQSRLRATQLQHKTCWSWWHLIVTTNYIMQHSHNFFHQELVARTKINELTRKNKTKWNSNTRHNKIILTNALKYSYIICSSRTSHTMNINGVWSNTA